MRCRRCLLNCSWWYLISMLFLDGKSIFLHLAEWLPNILPFILTNSLFLVRNWWNFFYINKRQRLICHLSRCKDIVLPRWYFFWQFIIMKHLRVIIEFSPLSFITIINWLYLWRNWLLVVLYNNWLKLCLRIFLFSFVLKLVNWFIIHIYLDIVTLISFHILFGFQLFLIVIIFLDSPLSSDFQLNNFLIFINLFRILWCICICHLYPLNSTSLIIQLL